MKKVILMFALVIVSLTACTPKNGSANTVSTDSTSVDTVQVDSVTVDTVAIVK